MARRIKTSIEGLTLVSFYHMLVLSFFVTVELLPGHDAFKAIPIHFLLLLNAGCFEVFISFVFVRNIPDLEAEAAFEFFGLMVGNAFMALLMDAMISWIMLIIMFAIWLTAIFAAYGYYRNQSVEGADVKSGNELVGCYRNEANALMKTIQDLEKIYATRASTSTSG